MAGSIKISELPDADVLDGTEYIGIVQGGDNKKTTPVAFSSVLGLGTMATQAASNVAITGGSVTGITDLAIADGGTGASTAKAALDNLTKWFTSISSALSSVDNLLVPAGTWSIDGLTIAATKTLVCEPGVTLTGTTATILGRIVAGDYQIFDSGLTVSFGTGTTVGEQQVLNAAWFGLIPGATLASLTADSSTAAFNRWTAALKTLERNAYSFPADTSVQPSIRGIVPNSTYLVDDVGINLTSFRYDKVIIDFQGANILARTTGVNVIETGDSRYVEINNLHIIAPDPSNLVQCGILAGRASGGAVADRCHVRGVHMKGYYSLACYYNIAGEMTDKEDCWFRNNYDGGKTGGFAAIETASNYYDVAASHFTPQIATTFESFNNTRWPNSRLQSVSNHVISLDGARNFDALNCPLDTDIRLGGYVTITGGTSNPGTNQLTSITIGGGANILAAAINWTTSNTATAALAVTSINSGTGTHGYVAISEGAEIRILSKDADGTELAAVVATAVAGDVTTSNVDIGRIGVPVLLIMNHLTSWTNKDLTFGHMEGLGNGVDLAYYVEVIQAGAAAGSQVSVEALHLHDHAEGAKDGYIHFDTTVQTTSGIEDLFMEVPFDSITAPFGGVAATLPRARIISRTRYDITESIDFSNTTLFSGEVWCQNADNITAGGGTNAEIIIYDNDGSAKIKTFNPTMTFATAGDLAVAYVNRNGTAVKRGRTVLWKLYCEATLTYTTSNGALRVGNLPWANGSTSFGGVIYDVGNFTWPAGTTMLAMEVPASQTYMNVNAMGTGVAMATVAVADLPTGTTAKFRASGMFLTAS